jgi:hypothetical protein
MEKKAGDKVSCFFYFCILKSIQWEEVISVQNAERFQAEHLVKAVRQEIKRLLQKQQRKKLNRYFIKKAVSDVTIQPFFVYENSHCKRKALSTSFSMCPTL